MTLKQKFDNIIFEELPEHLQSELETIKDETNDFDESSDEAKEIMDIWRVPFQYIYTGIQKKYPTALKDYVPPQPSEEELDEQRKIQEFEQLSASGDEKFENKDFTGALEDYNKALELGIYNDVATSKINHIQSEKERHEQEVEAEKIKREKAEKAKAIAEKYKKKEGTPASA